MSDLEDAVKSRRLAVAQNPQGADAHYELGKAYLNLGRHEEAIGCFKQAAARYRRAWSLGPTMSRRSTS